jgi:hypothetical protein
MKVRWLVAGNHTVASLRRHKRRQLNRRRASAASVISRMKCGNELRLTYERGKPCWSIGTTIIPDEIARIVCADHRVTGVGDALFPGMSGQSFKYVDLARGEKSCRTM